MLRLFVVIGVLWLSGCSPAPSSSPISQTLYVFGTEVSIQVYAEPHRTTQAQKAIAEIEQTFLAFHQTWHAWHEAGTVYQMNQAIRAGVGFAVDAQTKAFILKTQALSERSDYLFDPAIGQLVAMWGFHGEDWQGPPPTEAKRQAWLSSRPSIRDLYFEDLTLYSRNRDVQLDFGGNAKGLALNLAREILTKHAIHTALISIGGDLVVFGSKPDGSDWRIAVQDPKAPTNPLYRLRVAPNESVFTSGTYQRFYTWQDPQTGQTHSFSHIINPNTAWPADSFASVTVIAEDSIGADTAATALLIAGKDDWERIAQQLGITKVLLIERDGTAIWSAPMRERRLP